MKEKERFIPGKGYEVMDEKGYYTIRTTIKRPITDVEWNRQQVHTRVRMSKKERLALRRELGRDIVNKKH